METLGNPIAQGRTAQIYPWKDGRVVKLYFDWMNPNEVEFEARINAEVHAAGLPAPGGVEIVEVEGRRGVLFERIEGPTLLQAMGSQPWRIGYYADLMADLQAQLHRISLDWLRDIRGYFSWAIQHAPAGIPEAHQQAALERLAGMPESSVVCHGDFHPENIVLSPRGPVILDWVNACRGQPAADVARTYLMLRLGKPAGPMSGLIELGRKRLTTRYLQSYMKRSGISRVDIDAWELIVAAARRYENIDNERSGLVDLIAKCMTDKIEMQP
jgi:aminoglycoside phosphotransferase (APT) family kinase protein